MLQALRVTHIQQQVGDDDAEHDRRRKPGQRQCQCKTESAKHEGCLYTDGARGQRATAFVRMLPVTLTIGKVVADIDRRGRQRKGGRRQKHLHDQRRILPSVAEEQADEDESALHPLMRAQQFKPRLHFAASGK